MPNCSNQLLLDDSGSSPTYVGEAAHIAGENSGATTGQASARYDASMTPDQRNAIENLISICRICHKIIDTIPQGEVNYPTPLLLKIKHDHEAKVQRALEDGLAKVSFAQLEQATKWVDHPSPPAPAVDFSLIDVEAKIKKNGLTNSSRKLISAGIAGSKQVADYIEVVVQTDPDFPIRLISRFKSEYYRLVGEGHQGDDLFIEMCRVSQRGFSELSQQYAGLAVMIHLFEYCKLFKK